MPPTFIASLLFHGRESHHESTRESHKSQLAKQNTDAQESCHSIKAQYSSQKYQPATQNTAAPSNHRSASAPNTAAPSSHRSAKTQIDFVIKEASQNIRTEYARISKQIQKIPDSASRRMMEQRLKADMETKFNRQVDRLTYDLLQSRYVEIAWLKKKLAEGEETDEEITAWRKDVIDLEERIRAKREAEAGEEMSPKEIVEMLASRNEEIERLQERFFNVEKRRQRKEC